MGCLREVAEQIQGGALTRKKAIKVAEAGQTGDLKRVLNWFDLICFGVGGVIGSGLYVLAGRVAKNYAGQYVVLSFLIAGVLCAFCGLCYAEFAARYRGQRGSAGSTYTYTYLTFGEFGAWIIGWDLFLEYTIGAAVVARGWALYVDSLCETLGLSLPDYVASGYAVNGSSVLSINILACFISVAVCAILVVGIKTSARVSNTIVCIKLVTIFIIIGVGATLVDVSNYFVECDYGVEGIFRGASIVFFAYIGFDSVTVVAEEAKKPARDIPLGVLGTLSIGGALYMAVAAVMVGAVPYYDLDEDAALTGIFAYYGILWAEILVGCGAVIGLTSTLITCMMPQGRIFMSMSRDGLLWPVFGSISPTFGTPMFGTVLSGVLVSTVALLIDEDLLADAVSIGTLFAFSIVCTGILLLRYKRPGRETSVSLICGTLYVLSLFAGVVVWHGDLSNPWHLAALVLMAALITTLLVVLCCFAKVPSDSSFLCPLVPVVPFAGMCSSLFLMCTISWAAWLRLLIWFAVGTLVYFSYSVRHSVLAATNPHLDTHPPHPAKLVDLHPTPLTNHTSPHPQSTLPSELPSCSPGEAAPAPSPPLGVPRATSEKEALKYHVLDDSHEQP